MLTAAYHPCENMRSIISKKELLGTTVIKQAEEPALIYGIIVNMLVLEILTLSGFSLNKSIKASGNNNRVK